MGTATITEEREWISPADAAKIIGVKRDTMIKYANEWGIRVRCLPRPGFRFRLFNRADVMKFEAQLQINETAGLKRDGQAVA